MSTEKQPNSISLNDDYFIKNAISCWLHHFPNHKWTPIYKDMRDSNYQRIPEEPLESPQPRPTRRKPKQ